MTDRVRTVLVLTLVVLACDALVALTAFKEWKSFDAAPNNRSLVPGDDPTFVAAGVAYLGASALRYLVLIGLVVALVRARRGARRDECGAVVTRVRFDLAAAAVLVAVELGYQGATGTQSDPTAAWCWLRIITVAVSAIVCAVPLIATVRSLRPRRKASAAQLLA